MRASNKVVIVQLAVAKAIAASDYVLVSAILSEYLPHPLWSEQVSMTIYLNRHVNGALFNYVPVDGWCYVLEGA
jgi:hypothetical protein